MAVEPGAHFSRRERLAIEVNRVRQVVADPDHTAGRFYEDRPRQRRVGKPYLGVRSTADMGNPHGKIEGTAGVRPFLDDQLDRHDSGSSHSMALFPLAPLMGPEKPGISAGA